MADGVSRVWTAGRKTRKSASRPWRSNIRAEERASELCRRNNAERCTVSNFPWEPLPWTVLCHWRCTMRSFIDSAKASRSDLNRRKKCETNAVVITVSECGTRSAQRSDVSLRFHNDGIYCSANTPNSLYESFNRFPATEGSNGIRSIQVCLLQMFST